MIAATTGSCRTRCSPTRRSPSVGLTEAQAATQGLAYVVRSQDYGDIAYGWAMEDTTGFVQGARRPGTGLLLGAHLIGPAGRHR